MNWDRLKSIQEIILQERDWSWAVIAIVCLVIAMIIRGYFLKPLVGKAKALDKKHYQEIKMLYLKRSFWGWLMLLLSVAWICLVWIRPKGFDLQVDYAAGSIVSLLLLFLSIMLHLVAFGTAALSVLKKAEEAQKIL